MVEAAKTELAAAIERLYDVFGAYTPPQRPEFCRHCVSDEENAILQSVPLRQLSAQQLSRYSFKAISTWGTVEQFKYLLPRLFELAVQEEYRYSPEILFKKPRHGDFEHWPAAEQGALRDYCASLWRYTLAHHPLADSLPTFGSIDECLCCVAQIVDDMTPLLRMLASDDSIVTLHLADFVAENAWALQQGTLSNTFWKERPDQVRQVVDWFSSIDFALMLDLAELSTLPHEVAREVVHAVKRRIRST